MEIVSSEQSHFKFTAIKRCKILSGRNASTTSLLARITSRTLLIETSMAVSKLIVKESGKIKSGVMILKLRLSQKFMDARLKFMPTQVNRCEPSTSRWKKERRQLNLSESVITAKIITMQLSEMTGDLFHIA